MDCRWQLQSTGDPLSVLVTRRGSTAELTSAVSRAQFQDIKFKPGIARDAKGDPLASLEMITLVQLASVDAPDGINVNIRGLTSTGIELRHNLKLVSGRWFQQGRREVVVGQSISKRFPDAAPGKKLHIGTGDWQVVGIMDAGGSATNSEIFADLNLLAADYNRLDVPSSILLRATDEVAAAALVKSVKDDQRLNLDAQGERDYYAKQTVSAAPLQFLGGFVAIIMAVGSSFAAMNTMFAAVARRSREIGTLRVLGFSRPKYSIQLLPGIGSAGRIGRPAGMPVGAAAQWNHDGARQLHHLLGDIVRDPRDTGDYVSRSRLCDATRRVRRPLPCPQCVAERDPGSASCDLGL